MTRAMTAMLESAAGTSPPGPKRPLDSPKSSADSGEAPPRKKRDVAACTPSSGPESVSICSSPSLPDDRPPKGKQIASRSPLAEPEMHSGDSPTIPDPREVLECLPPETMRAHINWLGNILLANGQTAEVLADPEIHFDEENRVLVKAFEPWRALFSNSFPSRFNTIRLKLVGPGDGGSRTQWSQANEVQMHLPWANEGTPEQQAGVMLARLLRETWMSALPVASHAYLRSRGVTAEYPSARDSARSLLSDSYATVAIALLSHIPDQQMQRSFWQAVQGEALDQLDEVDDASEELKLEVYDRFHIGDPRAASLLAARRAARADVEASFVAAVSPTDEAEAKDAAYMMILDWALALAGDSPEILADLEDMAATDIDMVLDWYVASAGRNATTSKDVEYGLLYERALYVAGDAAARGAVQDAHRSGNRALVLELYQASLASTGTGLCATEACDIDPAFKALVAKYETYRDAAIAAAAAIDPGVVEAIRSADSNRQWHVVVGYYVALQSVAPDAEAEARQVAAALSR